MTTVIQKSSRFAGTNVQSSAQPSAPDLERIPGLVERQAAIENALTMALYFIRQPDESAANLWAATARANRALTLLKQASQGNAPASTANTLERA